MTTVPPGVPAAREAAFPVRGEPLVPPSGRTAVVVRALLAVGLLAGLVHTLTEPVERPLHELLDGLQRGAVDTVTIARPEPGVGAHGTWEVEWTGDGRPGRASYEITHDGAQPSVDEGQLVLDAAERSPAPVQVTVRDNVLDSGTIWNLGGLAGVAALLWLVGGPQPRLATKWAWFWLMCTAPLLWLAFVVLEPVPLWKGAPAPARPRRLTGGWALLLGITVVPFLGWVLTSSIPWVR